MKFLTRFHSGQSFAILWCLNWFLQNLANAFSWGEKICWKRTIKNFSTIFKKNFFDWFLSKVNHNRTPLFFGVSHGEHVSKVIHFGEKVQNHKKVCQKSWLFRKNLIFVTSTSPHFWWSIHAPALRPFMTIGWKSPRRLILWQFFRKCQQVLFFVRRTHDIQNFSMLKKQKFLNWDFWPRKCSKWPNLVPGAIKNMFWAQKEILKIFDFWT